MTSKRVIGKGLAKQLGQTLVLSMALIFMAAIGMFWVFNTGQVSADKQRVVNTADAAAYSAALWRARVLNYDAYSNRAMIANDVAVAQTLTLMSETQHLKNFARCLGGDAQDDGGFCQAIISYVLMFFPYVQQIFSYAATGLSYYDDGVLPPVAFAEAAYRSQAVNRALTASQVGLQLSTNFAVLQVGVVKDVVEANDAKFIAYVMPDTFESGGAAGSGFTKKYSDDERIRMATITKDSLDPFSKERNADLVVIPDICVAGVTLRKRGSTSLSSDMSTWEAADTFAEVISYLYVRIFPPRFQCRKDVRTISFGDRQNSGPSDSGFPANSPPTINSNAFARARNAASSNDNHDSSFNGTDPGGRWTNSGSDTGTGFVGIPSFYDLNYESLSSDDAEVRNPMHKLAVLVHEKASDLRTANNLNIGVGRLRMTENARDSTVTGTTVISALSGAEVYFKRPVPRASGDPIQIEYPSLFNPYWQARLAEPSLAQRAAALAY